MFTDFGKKPLLTNWLQGNVYFRFLKLKILLIPSYEKSPNLVAIDPKLKKLSTGKQNLRGKHLPPMLIGLTDERHVTANEESVSTCSETEDVCQRFSCKNRIKKLVKENQTLKSEMAKLKGIVHDLNYVRNKHVFIWSLSFGIS